MKNFCIERTLSFIPRASSLFVNIDGSEVKLQPETSRLSSDVHCASSSGRSPSAGRFLALIVLRFFRPPHLMKHELPVQKLRAVDVERLEAGKIARRRSVELLKGVRNGVERYRRRGLKPWRGRKDAMGKV